MVGFVEGSAFIGPVPPALLADEEGPEGAPLVRAEDICAWR